MNKIKLLSVNYNTPDLIYNMVSSFRLFYNNEILIIDGSNNEKYEETKKLLSQFDGITIHHFDYNIHHGTGMDYGFNAISSDQILVVDSDVTFLKNGILELLVNRLKKESYGIGDVQRVDNRGFNIGSRKGAIGLKESDLNVTGYAYLHPAFMLINKDIAMKWPMPIKHGAPMLETMIAITRANKEFILQHEEIIHHDFREVEKMYIDHPWCGTVNRTGGYNL